MPNELDPIVGEWYKNLGDGQTFEVVAVDEDEGTVEIQYFDGEIEEIDLENWYELDLESIEPPEDWSGPFDDLERDDLGYTDMSMHPDEWSNPLDELDRE